MNNVEVTYSKGEAPSLIGSLDDSKYEIESSAI